MLQINLIDAFGRWCVFIKLELIGLKSISISVKPVKRKCSNLKYVTSEKIIFLSYPVLKDCLIELSRKKKSGRVYKMHVVVGHDDGRLFITWVAEKKSFIFRLIYRRLLVLHAEPRENVIAPGSSTFRREFRMLPRRLFQVGIDRRLVMTYK